VLKGCGGSATWQCGVRGLIVGEWESNAAVRSAGEIGDGWKSKATVLEQPHSARGEGHHCLLGVFAGVIFYDRGYRFHGGRELTTISLFIRYM
jgi:hypothetical protein